MSDGKKETEQQKSLFYSRCSCRSTERCPDDKNVSNKRQKGGGETEDGREGRAQEAKKKVKSEWKADSNSKVNSVRGLECVEAARMTEGTLSIMQHSSFIRAECFHPSAQSKTVTGE